MSLRRSVVWAFLGQIVVAVVGFGSSVVVSRLLTPYEFGLNSIALATSGILAVFVASGADAFIVREVNLTRQMIATATTINAILFTTLSTALLAISFYAGPLLGDERAGAVVRILAIMPLLNILAFRPAAMLQRDMRFKAAAVVAITSVVVNNTVAIAAILAGARYTGPAIGAVSGLAATLILYLFIDPRELRPSFSTRNLGSMAMFGLRMVTVSGAGQFVHYMSHLILGRVLGIGPLGLYSRATLLANFIFSQLYGTATRVTFAQMSKVFRETGELKHTFMQSFYVILSAMWPLLVVLAILAKPALVILYGEQWTGAALPFTILLIAHVINLTFGMNWELFVIRDRLQVQTRYEIGRSLVGLLLFSLGCLVGLGAAAAGRLGDALIGSALYFPWLSRLSGARYGEILAVYRRAGLITVAAALPPLALMIATGWSAHPPILWLVASVLLGLVAWVGTLRWLRHPLLTEAALILSAGQSALSRGPFRMLRAGARADAAASPQMPAPMPTEERF